MNQLSKKAIASILSLVLVFVALGATTFAWFTLGSTATVGQFDLTARGSKGLEINFAGENDWYSTISSTKMNGYLAKPVNGGWGEEGKRLDAVTTKNGTQFFDFITVNPVEPVDPVAPKGHVQLGTNPIDSNEGTFLEFTLNFRTKEAGQELDVSSLTFGSITKEWTADVAYKNENNGNTVSEDKLTLNANYATRISFEGESVLSYKDAETTDKTGNEMNNIGHDLDKGAHKYLAIKHGLDSIILDTGQEDFISFDTNQTRVFEAGKTKGNKVATFGPTPDGNGYYSASVTVRVWIEGWDGNAYDAIFDANISFNFQFELVKPSDRVTP